MNALSAPPPPDPLLQPAGEKIRSDQANASGAVAATADQAVATAPAPFAKTERDADMKAAGGLFLIILSAALISWMSGPLFGQVPVIVIIAALVVQAGIGGALIKEWFGKR